MQLVKERSLLATFELSERHAPAERMTTESSSLSDGEGISKCRLKILESTRGERHSVLSAVAQSAASRPGAYAVAPASLGNELFEQAPGQSSGDGVDAGSGTTTIDDAVLVETNRERPQECRGLGSNEEGEALEGVIVIQPRQSHGGKRAFSMLVVVALFGGVSIGTLSLVGPRQISNQKKTCEDNLPAVHPPFKNIPFEIGASLMDVDSP